MKKYYVQYSYGEQEGPLDFKNVSDLILLGDINEEDSVWDDEKTEWRSIVSFDEFKESLLLKKNAAQKETKDKKHTVLLVDDDANILGLLKDLFEYDYNVLTAGDGLTALKIIHRSSPSVIVLDVMLPRLSGFAVLKRLKSNEKTKNIPVIMLTARGGADNKLLGIELSADEYIPKPFDITEVKKAVEKFVEKR